MRSSLIVHLLLDRITFSADHPATERSRPPPTHPEAHLKNAVTVATGPLDWNKPESWTGALDRCPCGTGTCAKMAVLHAKGQLRLIAWHAKAVETSVEYVKRLRREYQKS